MNVAMVVSHSESVRITKPVDAVWELVRDPGAWPRWAGDLRNVRVQGDLAPGALITYTYRGRPVSVTLSALERERLLEIAGLEKHYEMRERIVLEADDGSTKVSISMAFEPTARWARVVAPLAVPFKGVLLGRALRRSLRALQTAVEQT